MAKALKIVENGRFWYKDPSGKLKHNLSAITGDVVTAEQVGQEMYDRWKKNGVGREVVIESDDDGAETEVEIVKASEVGKSNEKKANAKKIWTCKEEDLAEMTIEELNMKIQQICATSKVPKKNRPEPFEDEVEAINFLTQDN